MGRWNSSEFADRIRRAMEWSRGVHGLPPKYRAPRERKAKVDFADLTDLSDQQLAELLKLAGSETIPEGEEVE